MGQFINVAFFDAKHTSLTLSHNLANHLIGDILFSPLFAQNNNFQLVLVPNYLILLKKPYHNNLQLKITSMYHKIYNKMIIFITKMTKANKIKIINNLSNFNNAPNSMLMSAKNNPNSKLLMKRMRKFISQKNLI